MNSLFIHKNLFDKNEHILAVDALHGKDGKNYIIELNDTAIGILANRYEMLFLLLASLINVGELLFFVNLFLKCFTFIKLFLVPVKRVFLKKGSFEELLEQNAIKNKF